MEPLEAGTDRDMITAGTIHSHRNTIPQETHDSRLDVEMSCERLSVQLCLLCHSRVELTEDRHTGSHTADLLEEQNSREKREEIKRRMDS